MAKTANAKTMRANDEDIRLIEKLKKITGITAESEIWRMGLRAAERELEAIPRALALLAETKRKPKA